MVSGGRRSAFSLIELIIIIGIIVVLGSILMPGIGMARKMAKQAACQNNERSLLTAMHQYVFNDTEGRLPYPNHGGPAPNGGPGMQWDCPAFPGWLYTWPHYGTTPHDMQTGTLWKYVNEERVYHCPMQDPSESDPSAPALNITSYVVNCSVYGDCPAPARSSYAYAVFKDPSEVIFLFECAPYGRDVVTGLMNTSIPPGYLYDGANRPTENTISDRHRLGAAVGFLDGHVEYYDFNMYQSVLAQKPGPLRCNPDKLNGV